MKKSKLSRALVVSLILMLIVLPLMAACAKPAEEAKYPSSPITVIVPWPPGGRSDLETRAWAPFVEKELGVPVVVANHAGGAGIVGARVVALGKPDGYTLGVFSAVHIMKQYTVDPRFELEKYVSVAQVADYAYTITVNAESPWQSLQEFLTYAKANPGKIKHGTSGGAGSGTHVSMSDFANVAGIEIQIIHYKGDAPAVTATAGKEVDFCGAPASAVKAMVEAGKLRVLAITSPERSPLYPDIPTVREQGVDWAEVNFSYVAAPKDTPAERIAVLEKAFGKALNSPEVLEVYKRMDVQLHYRNSKEMAEFIDKADAKYLRILTDLGLVIKK